MERIKWIDVAKGIGIVLIVLSHNNLPTGFREFLFSFHVPLFFFLSGLTSHKHITGFKEFFLKKIKSLLVPYFTIAFITFIFWLFIRRFDLDILNVDPVKPFIGIFYGNGFDPWMIFNAPLWFLPCLFTVEIIFSCVLLLSRKNAYISMYLVLFCLLGFLDQLYMPFRLPWGFDAALVAVVFYGAGFLLKDILAMLNLRTQLLVFVSCVLVSYITNINMGMNDINWMIYSNYFLFVLSAFAGIGGCIIISQWIKSFGILEFIGRFSLIIFGFQVLALKFTKGVFVYGFQINFESTKNSILWCLAYTFIALAFILCIINLYKSLRFVIRKKMMHSETI
ncbi:acyltransferase family protein [Paenibacillus tengchongensis]|uniref:acyltransferase family protein n=1 Tax=Paenibacillus tengchongensis TaxID=2608684 RepID=UPI001652399A|nr:acyltransferase family protein [Paenibacillus tengchongensis]